MNEKIVCSAIWYKELSGQIHKPINIDSGIVVCGFRHIHCIELVKTLSGFRSVRNGENSVGKTIQGFLTNKNRFVDRIEAYEIAKNMNQLNDRVHNKGFLYSEDLY